MKEWGWPLLVFGVICALGFGARKAIGNIYSSGEALVLLEALVQPGLFVGSAIATASATILALMLTLIGMVRRTDTDFGEGIYRNVDRVAKLATASLMASLLLLLVQVFPVGEFDGLPSNWYSVLYDALFAGMTIAVGLLAATVTMVYRTVHFVIARVAPDDEFDTGH